MHLRPFENSGVVHAVLIAEAGDTGEEEMAFALRLNAEAATSRLPIVLLASLREQMTAAATNRSNIVGVVAKPIREQNLRRMLIEAVGGRDLKKADTLSNPATEAASTVPAVNPPLPTLRILVVEDNVVNQRVVQMQLKKMGYDPDFANNGRAALQALERVTYDVVFMDCQMPEMDGYEATRCLRRDHRFARLPIVAMTANAMAGDREKCLAAGMNDFVAKPTREANLLAALERVIQLRGLRPPAEVGIVAGATGLAG